MEKLNQIKNDEHVFISGITGSGKTYWIETYLAGANWVLKLDTKGESLIKISQGEHPWIQVNNDDLVIYTDFQSLTGHNWKRKTKVIYCPDFEELDDSNFLPEFFKWAYFKFNNPNEPFVLWVDELKDVVPNPQSMPRYLKAFYSKGRFFKSVIYGASQEPAHLHSMVMSQATHIISFDLPMLTHRKKLSEMSGAGEFLQPLQKYYFWYFKRGWSKAEKGILEGG